MTTKPGIEVYIGSLSLSTKVLFGTVSGMVATALLHPLDVIKVRLQISDAAFTTGEMARRLVRCEGARGLYSGFTAGLMRQATSTTTRLFVYHLLTERANRELTDPNPASLTTDEKVVIGVYAGLAGALAAIPTEVALVRMMADGPKDPCSASVAKKRYRGVVHAFFRIVRDEGATALFRGGVLTLTRSVFVSVAQIGTYSKVNQVVGQSKILEGVSLHIFTSLVSSFVTTLVTLPLDLVKSRYQVRRDSMTQRQILNIIIEKRGVKGLWKGFLPYLIRLSLHTIASLIVFENLTVMYYEQTDKK